MIPMVRIVPPIPFPSRPIPASPRFARAPWLRLRRISTAQCRGASGRWRWRRTRHWSSRLGMSWAPVGLEFSGDFFGDFLGIWLEDLWVIPGFDVYGRLKRKHLQMTLFWVGFATSLSLSHSLSLSMYIYMYVYIYMYMYIYIYYTHYIDIQWHIRSIIPLYIYSILYNICIRISRISIEPHWLNG